MRAKVALVPLGIAVVGAVGLVLDATDASTHRVAKHGPAVTRRPAAEAVVAPRPALPAAEPARPTLPAAPVASPNDRPARQLELREGAKVVALHLIEADRASDVLSLGGALATDPEMCGFLEREAAAWRASAEPALRARGVLVLVALGKLDAEGWDRALATEADAAARARLVEAAPRTQDRGRRLLALVERDESPDVRAAAVRALPAELDSRDVARLATLLERDPSARVRTLTATWFRATKRSDGNAVRSLVASATRTDQDLEVRRASVLALLGIEETTPGTLRAAGVTAEELHELVAQGDRT